MVASLLSDQQRLDWLRLIRTENIGPRTFRALLDRYGGAAGALEALPEIARRSGKKLKAVSVDEAEREMAAARRMGVRFVALGEAEYPAPLHAIDSAPPLLAVRGHAAALSRPMVAIVGSRNASATGLRFTDMLARELAEASFCVVSGLARGIDTRAHKASLERGTIAVLAGGHDRLYPAENAGLLEALLESGAAVSEMPMGWTPRGRDFPRRNRIVSGLSLGTVVVEAARKSGSLITARFALEQGREVFAVPGSPLDPRAQGTNDLIRQGAALCSGARDVVDTLMPLVETGPKPGLLAEQPLADGGDPLWDELDLDGVQPPPAPIYGTAGLDYHVETSLEETPAARLVRLLGPVPIPVDELVRVSGLPVRDIQIVLMELEMAGRIERHGGQAVSLVDIGSRP